MTAVIGHSPQRASRGHRESAGDQARLDVRYEADGLKLIAVGPWSMDGISTVNEQLQALISSKDNRQVKRVGVDLSQVTRMDTTGAWLIKRAIDCWSSEGVEIAYHNTAQDRVALLESVAHCEPDTEVTRRSLPRLIEIADRTGQATLRVLNEAATLTGFFGLIVLRLVALFRHPTRLRLTSVQFHMEATGLNAIPIVLLLSFLVGVVIAYQGALQLRQFGAEVFTIDLLGFSVLRELGVLITSIIVAGRSGSAFAAQIGTMKVNEEVDAMQTMGLDIIDYLVLPRVIALMLTLPLLVFMANLVAILGGAFISWAVLDIEFGIFLRRLRDAVDVTQLWVGLVKAPVFAFAIAMAGCYEGLKVKGSAQSVGQRTTAAVVEAIFLVIVLDAAFSILFAFLGI